MPREHISSRRMVTSSIRNTVRAARGDARVVGAERIVMSASEKDRRNAAINSAGRNSIRTGRYIFVSPFQTNVARGRACSKGKR